MAGAQAGLGWALGVCAPASYRRLRMWCAAAALLPDVDALALLSGTPSIRELHFSLAHNCFAGILLVAAAGWYFRNQPVKSWLASLALVAVAFGLHLTIDLKLSGAPLRLFWPLDRRAGQVAPLLAPGHPAHAAVAWGCVALPWVLAFWRRVTPLEILSPRLDTLFLNAVLPRRHDCYSCGRRCNNRCSVCSRPVCFRHGVIDRHFHVTCPSCRSGSPAKALGTGVEDYLARELSFLRSRKAVELDAEFASFLFRKLSDGLRRLDDLPRTHPLWQGSNHQPTLPKLANLCRTLLRDAPDDEESRWILFADKVLSSSADLGFPEIEPLLLRDFASIRWLMAAARWNYLLTGIDPVVALRKPLDHLGRTVGSVEDCLKALEADLNPRTKEAAAWCLDILHERNPFKAATPA